MTRSTGKPVRVDPLAEDGAVDAAALDAVERAAAVLCKRWKPALLCLIAAGHHRYTALARRLPAASSKMLTQQLRDLERDGLIDRVAHSRGRRHVEYTLTPAGEALRPVVEALAAWGHVFEGSRHAAELMRSTHERAIHRDEVCL